FAGDGGLWIGLLSPAAQERIAELDASERWIPPFLSLQTALENSRKDQTYNTPAVATLFLLANQLRWMLERGGLEWCVARARSSSEHLYGWGQRRPRRGAPARALRRRAGVRLGRAAARRADRRVPGDRDPLGHQDDERADRAGARAARHRTSGCRRGQRRCRGRDQARDRRRQRASVQRRDRGRAHHGAAAGARAQRPAGALVADGRALGALALLGRRAVREDARDPRLRPHRAAGGAPREEL